MSDQEKTNSVNPAQNSAAEKTLVEQDITPVTRLNGDERIQIGPGVLVERIGKGGMAEVYKFKHLALGTYYAVKIALPEQQENHSRFVSEAKITAKLKHTNIINIHEICSWNSLPYIEMDFIEGITLREILEKIKALPVPVACAIAYYVVKALKFAHTKTLEIGDETYKGVIHRDLKPENIMISKEGRVVVMDFGLARPIQASLNSTVTGCFSGTPQYASPEQLRTEKEKVDQRSDIYAMGVILYEMLCGFKPFRSFDQKNEWLSSYAAERAASPCIPLQKRKRGIPPRLVKIIDKCIDPDETKRYAGAAGLLTDLEAAMPKGAVDKEELLASFISLINSNHTGVLNASPRQHHPWVLPAVIGFGAAVLGLFVVLLLRTGPRDMGTHGAKSDRLITATPAASGDSASYRVMADTPLPKPDNGELPAASLVKTDDKGKPNDAEVEGDLQQKPEAAADKEPVVKEVPPSPQPTNGLEALRTTYGKSDPIAIAVAAIKRARYSDALLALDSIPAGHPDHAKKTVLAIECCVRTGRFADAQRIAALAEVSSMEYDYLTGRIHFANGSYDKAIDCFNRALLDKPLMQQRRNEFIDETLFYTARSFHKRYAASPHEDNLVAAREAWQTVKQRFVHKTNDKRYKEAVRALSELEK